MRDSKAAVFLATALLMLAAGCGGEGQGGADEAAPSPPPTRAAADGSRVALIVLENHGFRDVIGNPAAPYLNRLAQEGALAARYRAATHPSLPNYLALTGGSTFGIEENCTDCWAEDPNLALQLSQAGFSWRAYMEDMPEACSTADAIDGYAKRHNPFMYFRSIAEDPSRCANVVPEGQLKTDLNSSGGPPAFSWISPNLCHDAHDCGLDVADDYVSELAKELLPRLGPQGFLVVTFDEGNDEEDPSSIAGGRVATILAGPSVRSGARLDQPFDHYSLLGTVERAFGLSLIRKAKSARLLRPAFSSFPQLRAG